MSGVDVLERLRGGLIVSCQAYDGDPLDRPGLMPVFALSAEAGGAAAVRLEGLADVREGADRLGIPVVGIVKSASAGVRITPTLADALALARAGAGIVAVDGTRRARPDGRSLREVVDAVHAETDALVMADCGSLGDARAAQDAGADLLGTTLSGYTGERPAGDGPDLDLVAEMCATLERPVVAEGRIWTPAQARAALDAGAHAVCVGSAITHPGRLTARFAAGLG
jgi:N-acylglucosamine-6-phosphate 2-epimerase